jgi:8-oxo-dGTP pyrophosphatase MutT (NUDIX family)
MLRRRLSHPPLTSRLDRLRKRLAVHQPRLDEEGGELIWAAVAVVLAPDPDAVLLIRRSERVGDPWSGHMALPGGRRGPEDLDLAATAVRETAEEVGLELGAGRLIGSLDDVVPRTPVLPPIAVRPYVFLLPARPRLSLNPEVAAAQWVSLDHLLDPATYHTVRLDIRGESRDMPAYQLEDGIVWGMTERVITSLLAEVRGGDGAA